MGDLWTTFWAKKDEHKGNNEWLPLKVHLEDTSRVCGFLWDHWLCDGQRQIISGENDQNIGRQVMLFLGAIHDLGKATPAFQTKSSGLMKSDLDYELLERLERTGAKGITNMRLANAGSSPHNIAGEALLRYFDERFCHPEDICSIVGGHHGRPVSKDIISKQLISYKTNYFQSERDSDFLRTLWEKNQRKILSWAIELAGFTSPSEIPILSVPAQVQALGLLTMADWIASNTKYFPLMHIEEENMIDSRERLENGMIKWFKTYGWITYNQFDTKTAFEHRFGFTPRPVQKIFIDTIASTQKPGLFILEAPMGMGKTEAALMGAEELAYKADRKGVFFGLPTQATSNGIFPRIQSWLQNISKDNDSKNELRLIHGKAHLNSEYVKLINSSDIASDSNEYEAFVTNQWFSGKKTAIMDDFVVGTVDQFLMIALKQKHLALRQLGFAKKVVIIDEVHAYDAYMNQYLQMALTWMASYRVPVILLSATLSSDSRQELTKSYLKGLGIKTHNIQVAGKTFEEYLSSDDYPLITYTDGGNVCQVKDFPPNTEKDFIIQRIHDSDIEDIIDDIFANGGGNIGVIVNTVKRAQEFAKKMAVRYGEENIELLHSSFLATERVCKEENLMKMIGQGKNIKRPEKKIVVGTQVIEQSLDIDFDAMISDLAPIDLLIQRLGRLHRHDRTRPFRCVKPTLYLLGCSNDLIFEEGSESVYGGYYLARTQFFLGENISIPGDISPLVQSVYGNQDIELEFGNQEKYEEYKRISKERQVRKRSKAKTYCLKSPYLKKQRIEKLTLHDWLENITEEKSDEIGHSQVRDADESIEVIALRKLNEGYGFLFGKYAGIDLSNQIQNEEISMQIAGETLRLPRSLCLPYQIEKTIHELENIYLRYFKNWDESSWLRGSLGILFDQELNCRLNGYILHYDQKYGLSYQKED